MRVEGFPPSISLEHFRDWVAQFGTVVWVRLVLDTNERHVRSAYGYVDFATAQEAEHAKGELAKGARLEEGIHISYCRDVMQHRSSTAAAYTQG